MMKLFSKQAKDDIAPFTTDGCSMWPDENYGGCCVEHDKAYHKGGTKEQRLEADIKLMQCVAAKHSTWMARLMFIGICFGGVPYLPLSWRWGYGYKFYKGYEDGGR